MNCPECDQPTLIAHTKRLPGHQTRRRRACENGHRFITLVCGDGEVYLGPAAALTTEERAQAKKYYNQLVDTLGRANLTPQWQQACHLVLINVKTRLGITGGKSGLRTHRGQPVRNINRKVN